MRRLTAQRHDHRYSDPYQVTTIHGTKWKRYCLEYGCQDWISVFGPGKFESDEFPGILLNPNEENKNGREV